MFSVWQQLTRNRNSQYEIQLTQPMEHFVSNFMAEYDYDKWNSDCAKKNMN